LYPRLSTIVKLKIVSVVFYVFTIPTIGQNTVDLTGVVLGEAKQPLLNANILAFPNDEGASTQFAISNNKGEYRLKLDSGVSYSIQVSYLGYQKLVFDFSAAYDTVKELMLQPKTNELQEVVLEYKIPIEIKEDTITYNTDAFVTGNERKLREVLKKLPGIEVDREGNVTAQGQKVTKVLVEDKPFFTGNSKLAVNNIPADAVDQVQVLENYNDIGFLKGLQDSDEVALNIKLKEDKKKFAFGDVEAAAGVENRYLIHPNLFYYSPQTNINFIGDLNNLGVKSFTLSDYFEFNGGFGNLLADINSYIRLSNDDFSQFLRNNDFNANTNRFGALNIRQSLSPKTAIDGFVIASDSDTETATEIVNTYNSVGISFDEKRNQNNNLDNFFVLGKLVLDHEPDRDTDIALSTFTKINQNNTVGRLSTQSFGQIDFFNTLSDLNGVDLRQNLEYSKRFSRAQTVRFESTFSYGKNKTANLWQTNEPFLENLIPLELDDELTIAQQKETASTAFDVLLKDFWVLDNYNHVYTTVGTSFAFENYETQETQELTDGSMNDFSRNGFGNAIEYRFNDTFLGLEYKFLSGIFTVKSGIFYHNYFWKNTQSQEAIRNNTQLLLPEFNAEAKFSSTEKLRFNYAQRAQLPRTSLLVGNFVLNSFNSVLIGNSGLQNERIHSYSLNYNKFSLFRGLTLNTGIFYNRKSQSIKNNTVLSGIEQFVTYTMFNEPENMISANFIFSKKINTVKLGVEGRGSYREFFQLVNSNISKNISKTLSLKSKMETFFEKGPNFEVGYTYQPSLFSTTADRNRFSNTEFYGNLDYTFLEDFSLKMDYRRTVYQNQNLNVTNTFDLANAALFYQEEDSPWGFELAATNLFNIQFKRQNAFSDFLISDQTTFIIPRIAMFKVVYRL